MSSLLSRWGSAVEQLRFLRCDVRRRAAPGQPAVMKLLSSGLAPVAAYRVSRLLYLALGDFWGPARLFCLPLRLLLRPWFGGCEIDYRADIGPGLVVFHPSLGVVVSERLTAGANLTLVGGNCIGERKKDGTERIILGDGVTLGVNGVILGPVRIGHRAYVGAGAVVIADAEDDDVLVGVPARPLPRDPAVMKQG